MERKNKRRRSVPRHGRVVGENPGIYLKATKALAYRPLDRVVSDGDPANIYSETVQLSCPAEGRGPEDRNGDAGLRGDLGFGGVPRAQPAARTGSRLALTRGGPPNTICTTPASAPQVTPIRQARS